MTTDAFYMVDGESRSLFQRNEIAQVSVDENNKIIDLIIESREKIKGDAEEGARRYNEYQEQKLIKEQDENISSR